MAPVAGCRDFRRGGHSFLLSVESEGICAVASQMGWLRLALLSAAAAELFISTCVTRDSQQIKTVIALEFH
jgi:hypothetical protein